MSGSSAADAERKKVNKLVAALLGGVESLSASKAVAELACLAECSAMAVLIRKAGGEVRLEVMAAGAEAKTAELARAVLARVAEGGPRPERPEPSKSSSYGQRPQSWRTKPHPEEKQRKRQTSRAQGPSLATLGDYIAVARATSPSRKSGGDPAAPSAAEAKPGVFAVGVGSEDPENVLPANVEAARNRAERCEASRVCPPKPVCRLVSPATARVCAKPADHGPNSLAAPRPAAACR
eukprot:scaffold1548_cov117-Isochrysis_galbana.AAC.3